MNTVKALSEMPALEPILVKQMLINTERELTSIKTAVHDLEDRSLNLEDLKDKCQKCQVSGRFCRWEYSMGEIRMCVTTVLFSLLLVQPRPILPSSGCKLGQTLLICT